METEENQNVNRGRWNEQEKKQFIEAIRTYGKDWKKITESIKTRNITQVRSHAQKFFNKGIQKNHIKNDRFNDAHPDCMNSRDPDFLKMIIDYQQAYIYHSVKAQQILQMLAQRTRTASQTTNSTNPTPSQSNDDDENLTQIT